MKKALFLVLVVAFPASFPSFTFGGTGPTFRVTAYHGAFEGKKIPITKSGTIAASGRTIAVDPKVLPLGSAVLIDGIGCRIAEDTGSAIKGNRLDLYVRSISAARKFGVRHLSARILGPTDELLYHSRDRCLHFLPSLDAAFYRRTGLHDPSQGMLPYLEVLRHNPLPNSHIRGHAKSKFHASQVICDRFESVQRFHGLLTP